MSKRILFVDDDVPLRVTLSMYFKFKGLEVTAATDCQDALRLAADRKFDVAIVDIGLGEESGLDLLDSLGREHPCLPVVMFTSEGNNDDLRADSIRRGAKAYFSKTESLDILFHGVTMVMT
jgi:DNA-binding response OmpR family regulator